MAGRAEIEARFTTNLERVGGLVGHYESMSDGTRGRKTIMAADQLRVAVVLLHATLEDLVRSLAEWKLPTAPPSSLEKIPIAASDKPADKITLAELARSRGQTVDDLIADSIEKHLERSSFNSVAEIMDLLGRIEIKADLPAEVKSKLAAMMNRRHWIAHRVDRNRETGPGHQAARSISLLIVQRWIVAVTQFGAAVLNQV